jgi:hypothetical protein
MSYNPNPEWAPVDDSVIQTIPCPECGEHLVLQGEDDENPLYQGTYYHPRHIPPEVIMWCVNYECDLCEVEVVVKLKVNLEVAELYEPN